MCDGNNLLFMGRISWSLRCVAIWAPAVVLANKQRKFESTISAFWHVFVGDPRWTLWANFFLCGVCEQSNAKEGAGRTLKVFFRMLQNSADFTCGLSLSVTRRHIILAGFTCTPNKPPTRKQKQSIIATPLLLSARNAAPWLRARVQAAEKCQNQHRGRARIQVSQLNMIQ